MSPLCRGYSMESALGLSSRLRFLAAFGWCRNDRVALRPAGTPIFEGMAPAKGVLLTYLAVITGEKHRGY